MRPCMIFVLIVALIWNESASYGCCALATLTPPPSPLPLHHDKNTYRRDRPRRPTTTTTTTTRTLNGDFGICLDGVTVDDLADPDFQRRAYDLWLQHGGLLAVRGDDLATLTPQQVFDWARVFGQVQTELPPARQDMAVPGQPGMLRIGNVRDDASGKYVAQFTNVPRLRTDADVQYDPTTQRPVWHTDGTFQRDKPVGSVFYCRQTPPPPSAHHDGGGGATLFADTARAYQHLEPALRRQVESLEAVCSLAHHDQKVHRYTPEYPTLSAGQRAANPPQRVPLVLKHALTGRRALYGWNSSTCALVPRDGKRGEDDISQKDLDTWDLEGIEDDSVTWWRREILPRITAPAFTVQWTWQPGDIVVWDNRCTLHAATGFDHEKYVREMWRVTLVQDRESEEEEAN